MKPADPIGEQATASQGVYERLARYPLLNALIERRSRRFGEGMSLNGGPLAYHSTHAPQPLSLEEEAALVAFMKTLTDEETVSAPRLLAR